MAMVTITTITTAIITATATITTMEEVMADMDSQ
jgi:hypothetical protein